MFALHVIRSTQASRKLLILVVESIASTSVLVLLRNKQAARQNLKMRHGYPPWRIFLCLPYLGGLIINNQFKSYIDMVAKLYFVVHIVEP